MLGTTLVALGRFAFFGQLIATTLRYGADLAAPLFLGLALAITPTSAAAIRQRLATAGQRTSRSRRRSPAASRPQPWPAGRSPPRPPSRTGRAGRTPRPAAPAGSSCRRCGGAAVAGRLPAVGRGLRPALGRQSGPPLRHALTANIADAGPGLNLYDSTVSQAVLPIFFGPRWHLSDFLPLTGQVPTFDAPATEPLLADDKGVLRPAVLVPAATRQPPPGGLCAYLRPGAGSWRIPLDPPAPEGDGFLRIDYLQPRPSTAEVMVEDLDGAVHAPLPRAGCSSATS